MTSPSNITVIDAGVGNLGNVRRALNFLRPAAQVEVTESAAAVERASVVLLPGVGAFRPPREAIRGALEQALHSALENGAFLLGICVGYQLLFDEGEEFGGCDGLGLLPGKVLSLPKGVPLPHIGWNRLRSMQRHPLTDGLADEYAYFVHTFVPSEVPSDLVLATCLHGEQFPAIAARGRVMGTQFHPEKSGPVGLRLLDNFLDLAGVRRAQPAARPVETSA